MALLNIQAVSPQMDANFNAKILNFRMIDEGKYTVSVVTIIQKKNDENKTQRRNFAIFSSKLLYPVSTRQILLNSKRCASLMNTVISNSSQRNFPFSSLNLSKFTCLLLLYLSICFLLKKKTTKHR